MLFEKDEEYEKYYQSQKMEYGTKIILHASRPIGRRRLVATVNDSRLDRRIGSIVAFESASLLSWYDEAPPNWMKYAVQTAFEKFRFRFGTIDFAEANDDQRINLKKSEWRDWSVAVAGAPDEVMEREKTPTNTVQAQLWLLGDWMLFGSAPQGTACLNLCQSLRTDAASTMAAFERGIGMSSAQLTDQLRQHFKKPYHSRSLRFDTAGFDASVRESPASAQELHLIRFQLLFGREPIDTAFEALQRAVAEGPASDDLRIARVLGAKLQNDRETMIAVCREAIAAGTRDPFFYLNSAEARLYHETYSPNEHFGLLRNSRSSLNATVPEVQAALDEYRTAQRLDPANPFIHALLAQAIDQLPSVTREHAEELTPGLTIHPNGLYIRLVRGYVYKRLGATAESEADFEYLLTVHPDSPQARIILKQREKQATAEANAEANKTLAGLYSQRRFAAARRVLIEMRANEKNVSRQRAFEKEIKRLEELLDWDEVTTLMNAKRWAEVAIAAESYIEHFPKSHRVQVMKNRLHSAQEQLRR
ncbi:MAG: hypothetical protein IPN11_07340 [Opitutaceae bacterium]|nr:hypothetical protein [Opitutaceae bacterium]